MQISDLANRYIAKNGGTLYQLQADGSAIIERDNRYIRLNGDGSTQPVRLTYLKDNSPAKTPPKEGENPFAERFYQLMDKEFLANPKVTWSECRTRVRQADTDLYLAAFGHGANQHGACVHCSMRDGMPYDESLRLADTICEDQVALRMVGGG